MDFTSIIFEKQNIRNLACVGQDLSHKEFSECTFTKCDLSGCDFSHSSFLDCVFEDCNLSNIKVYNCSFQGVRFESCKLLGVIMSEVNTLLVDWTFDKCNILLCDFSRLEMKRSVFTECEIRETDFANVNLAESDFSGSDLAGSKFQEANLEKTNFVGASNYYIDPIQNKLKGARFSSPEVLALLAIFGIKVEY